MMYSNKEIKTSLRKYMESSGTGTIDEQAIIDILDEGADRDFDKASQKVKEIRQQFGVKRAIPDWLRMLTFRLIYDCMVSDKQVTSSDKKQETLLAALGFNKKVFDGTSWKMYSPEMKIRQSRFNPVDLPFTYAEVESNPIYVAMLHNIISESRVATNVFVDVFGKMGYVPAFCAEGYAHKLLFTNDEYFTRYYHGITDMPTKAFNELKKYKDRLSDVQREEKNTPTIIDNYIEEKMRGLDMAMEIYKVIQAEDICKFAIIRFFIMCFDKPYWQNRYTVGGERMVESDFSARQIKKFMAIAKENFISYAQALKKVSYQGETADILRDIFELIMLYREYLADYYDIDYDEELNDILLKYTDSRTPLLYFDAPNIDEYKRYAFHSEEYMELLQFLINYKGDWILTMKNYSRVDDEVEYSCKIEITAKGAENADKENSNNENDKVIYEKQSNIEKYALKDFKDFLKTSERPLYEYIYSSSDRNVRTSISFISPIDCDSFTQPYFKSRYGLKLKTGDQFKKQRLV